MTYIISVVAAVGCALANGVSAVLQKAGADSVETKSGLRPSLLWRLGRNVPYLSGLALDVVGWVLLLIAVRSLPLFLTQAIVAAAVVVTATVEVFVLHVRLQRQAWLAIVAVMVGLCLVGVAAAPGTATPVSSTVRFGIICFPVVIAGLAALAARSRRYPATVGLAALGGLAFGMTAVVGRMFPAQLQLGSLVSNGLTWALIAYGILGVLLFTTALQRGTATAMNAIMIACDTLIPALLGIIFFDDIARPGLWPLAIFGASLVVVGSLTLVFHEQQTT